jgi:hypothetical protein
MNTAKKMLTLLIATGLSTASMTAMAGAGQHTKVLRLYNHTPMVRLDVQADFVDEDIQRFADVQDELRTIEQNFSARIDNAPNAEARKQLGQEYTQAMTRTIEAGGMTVDSYSRVAIAAQSHPGVRADIQQKTERDLPVDMMYGTRYIIAMKEKAPLSNKVHAAFTEEQLLSYVAVQDELALIRDRYSEKVLRASDERDAELLVEAKRAMADAVEKAGLYREEYANISLAIDADPKLRSRVQKMRKQHAY